MRVTYVNPGSEWQDEGDSVENVGSWSFRVKKNIAGCPGVEIASVVCYQIRCLNYVGSGSAMSLHCKNLRWMSCKFVTTESVFSGLTCVEMEMGV